MARGTLALAVVCSLPGVSRADEGGVSFWLPGLYGSLAAVPQAAPGWSFYTFNYYTNVSAGADVSAAREVQIGGSKAMVDLNLSATLHAQAELEWVQPNYAFATPVLGGQLMVSMGEFVGWQSANVAGTLSGTVLGGPSGAVSGSITNSVTGFSDMYPSAALKWNDGVNNYMIFGDGDIPVGAYQSTRLANLGIGHGAADGGVGYTYLNPQTGREFSAVAGLTYNLENPSTNYQNGVDFHLDWGASQFLSKQVFVGPVGYFYDQLSCDSGSGDRVGCFESRVVGIGPQIGYLFPIGNMQGYLNLKAYGEFDAAARPSGWNAWLTFSISPAAPTPATPSRPMITK
ncbi:MAG: transporter [Methylocella sp.]